MHLCSTTKIVMNFVSEAALFYLAVKILYTPNLYPAPFVAYTIKKYYDFGVEPCIYI